MIDGRESMAELKFQKLTPTHDVDLSGYKEALDYVFSEDDIKNIAVSGAYSSGKSSVIESYEKKHGDKRFIHLSLAHFQPFNGNTEENDTEVLKEQNSKNVESIIEGKILNQLIQQIPSDKIPQTSFRIKRSFGQNEPYFISFAVCIFFLLVMHCLNFSSWQAYVASLNEGCFKCIMGLTVSPKARLISGFFAMILLGIAIYNLIRVQYSKNIFRKISVQGNEIEIFSDSNDSFFDKYLNEVLYLFENADVDGIVFEDIDRFDNTTIFERLREINTLTNIRLKSKKDEKTKQPLRFFYLLRDDIFNNKDRTKFFDYILPVVPVLDSSNSYNKIKEYLEAANLYTKFDDHFLRGISLYIDDLRILKNIFNEFLIYDKKLNSIELDINRLFAIITYKNIFPKDFAELQLNRGFVYRLFKSKEKLIKEQTESLQKEFEELSNRIKACEEERLESFEELEWINNGRKEKSSRSWNASERQKYQQWFQTIYPQRKQAIEDIAESKLDKLHKSLEDISNKISKTQNLTLAELLNRDVIDSAFKVCFTNEIGEKEEFLDIKASLYFALLKYLISHGYIDESYSDYIGYFYSNSLTQNDKVFLRSVADRKGKQPNFPLNAPHLIFENLNEFDFSQRETLNFDLTEYILKENKTKCVASMINQIKTENRFDYLAGYILSGKPIAPMVQAINEHWPDMFYVALSSNALSKDVLKIYSYHTIVDFGEDTLKAVNIDGCLTNFISGDPKYLANDEINIEKVCESLIKLKVTFGEIDFETANKKLFDLAYRNNLYDINKSNILLILKEIYQQQDVPEILKSFFSFLRSNQGSPFSNYLWDNLKETLHIYLAMYESDIDDTSDTIVDLINSKKIDDDDRKHYIKRLVTHVVDLSQVTESSVQKLLLETKRVQYSVNNILYYFNQNNLNTELIAFINSDIAKLDYSKNGEESITKKFLNACIKCKKLDNEKYQQITDNLCEPIEAFDVADLTEDKLLILINQKLIPMNANNLSFVRNNYASAVFKFIDSDIASYIQLATDSLFNFDELLELLTWSKITDKQKINLIKMTKEPISISEGKFSDELIIFILKNNLAAEDFAMLVQDYTKYTSSVKMVIWDIVVGSMDNMVLHAKQICKELLNMIFSTDEIEFTYKVRILEKIVDSMNKDELCEKLGLLGADKIVNNLNDGNARIEVTEKNEQILEVLFNAGFINKYEIAGDNKHYKKIKSKENAVIMKSDETVVN